MPIIIMMLVTRKEDLSPAQFKSYYEEKHVPIIESIFGALMPTLYKRQYIERSEKAPHDATVLMGQQTDVPWDCITELVFADQQKIDDFNAVFYKPDVQKRIQEDEANFVQHEKMIATKVEDERESHHDP